MAKKEIDIKLGRPKMIDSPSRLIEMFQEYVGHTKSKPIKQHDFVGGMGKSVERKKERPLTMEGFENYVFMQGFNTELAHYFSNRDGRYTDFVTICQRIRLMIRQDQIEGGMAGIYNPSITQRLNGLKESVEESGSKEVTIKVKYERKDSNAEPTA
jgi:hypothetical protein